MRAKLPEFNIAPDITGSGSNVPTTAKAEHFVLTVRKPGTELKFDTKYGSLKAAGPEIRSYARAISILNAAKLSHPEQRSSNILLSTLEETVQSISTLDRKSMYDIELDKKSGVRWIIIELDPTTNWQFTPGNYGVSAKLDCSEEDHGLHFVIEDDVYPAEKGGTIRGLKEKEARRCMVLYWAIAARRTPQNSPEKTQREFNFYIQFNQTDDREVRTLPTIFDPSVPNDGGPQIP